MFKKWEGKGYLYKVDMIEELVRSIDVDFVMLWVMVDCWNGFVCNGMDEDFYCGECEYDNCGFVGDLFLVEWLLGMIEKGLFFVV